MKKAHIVSLICIGVLVSAVIFTACQKSSSPAVDNTTPTTEDAVALQTTATADDAADNVFNDAFTNVMGANDDAGLGGGIGVFFAAPRSSGGSSTGTPVSSFGDGIDSVPHCWTLTVDPGAPGAFPKTITIDFGTGCAGRDGHTRRGKIIAVFTGRMKEAGSSVTASFDGFYIDSIKVEGTLKATNNSTSSNRILNVTVTNGRLSTPSGNFVLVNRDHTWTQTEGNGTPNLPVDDVYSITGSSSGTAQASGITAQWTTEIVEPVIRKLTCRWRVIGQVKISWNSKTAVLDYGSGDCDNKATVTVGAKVYNIKLQ